MMTYDPNWAGSGIIHFCHEIWSRTGTLGSAACALGEHVASDEGEVLDELAGLRVGQEELSERAQVLNSLFAIPLCVVFAR